MKRALSIAAFAAFFVLNGHFVLADECRASLVTGLDTSASISPEEIQMQLDGMSDALLSQTVLAAFQSQGCVRISVFFWADGNPILILPWVEIATESDAQAAISMLIQTAASNTSKPGTLTNVGEALLFAEALLGHIPPTGRQVINIVSNGESNTGPSLAPIVARLRASGIKTNAVLFGPSATLEDWYRANVTNGFVLRINGPADFANVYRSKFQLDLASMQ